MLVNHVFLPVGLLYIKRPIVDRVVILPTDASFIVLEIFQCFSQIKNRRVIRNLIRCYGHINSLVNFLDLT